jgi:hypothetical protein
MQTRVQLLEGQNYEMQMALAGVRYNSPFALVIIMIDYFSQSQTALYRIYRRILLDQGRHKIQRATGHRTWEQLCAAMTQQQLLEAINTCSIFPRVVAPFTKDTVKLLYTRSNKVQRQGNITAHCALSWKLLESIEASSPDVRNALMPLYQVLYDRS